MGNMSWLVVSDVVDEEGSARIGNSAAPDCLFGHLEDIVCRISVRASVAAEDALLENRVYSSSFSFPHLRTSSSRASGSLRV